MFPAWFLFCILLITPASADSPQQLAASGRWEDALQSLLQEMPNNKNNASHYYNLGTVYYHLGQVGPATAYLAKARRLNPTDTDIQANYSMTQSRLNQLLGITQSNPWDQIPWEGLSSLLAILLLGLLLLWVRKYLKHREPRRAFSHLSGILGTLGFSALLVLLVLQQWAVSIPLAYCINPQILRSGPGESYLALTRVEAGYQLTPFGLSDPAENEIAQPSPWRQVRILPKKGEQPILGWIPESSLLLL